MVSRLSNIIRRHLRERKDYPRARDWFLSMYNRVLVHLRGVWLPGRGKVVCARVRDVSAPLRVRLDTTDWYTMEEVFLHGEYAPVAALAATDLSDVRNVLDLGANIGMSVRLWQTLWPAARVVGVEPDAANLVVARSNCLPTESTVPVLVKACAAGYPRTVHLQRSRGEDAFQMEDGAAGPTTEAIEALTVPELCQRTGMTGDIDLLKCDIEGAEAEVFANCADWIRRVRHAVVEVHHPYTQERLREDLVRAGVKPVWRHVSSKGAFSVIFFSCESAALPVGT